MSGSEQTSYIRPPHEIAQHEAEQLLPAVERQHVKPEVTHGQVGTTLVQVQAITMRELLHEHVNDLRHHHEGLVVDGQCCHLLVQKRRAQHSYEASAAFPASGELDEMDFLPIGDFPSVADRGDGVRRQADRREGEDRLGRIQQVLAGVAGFIKGDSLHPKGSNYA
jgi:hypothetical protein